VLKTLLDWFIDFEEEDIDMTDQRGMTALFHAADYASPQCIETLRQRGANPTVAAKIRPWVGKENILGSQGRLDFSGFANVIEDPIRPCEFVLYQIYFDQEIASRNHGQRPRRREMPGTLFALPMPQDLEEQQNRETYNKLRTIAALSVAPEAECALDNLDDGGRELASSLKIIGLIPTTAQHRYEVEEDSSGNLYLEVWGVYMFGNLEISIHVGLLDQLSAEEWSTKLLKHSYSKVVFHRSTTLEPYTFRFQVARRRTELEETSGSDLKGQGEEQ
jgi:hypothetical protein